MTNIQHEADVCNAIRTANNNSNTAFTESIFEENGSGDSPEQIEQKLLEADKCNAKIHYFSRAIAKEHGVIRATILSGFACKLKFHKLNKWNNRLWYYDSVETLRTHRWPYLSDGCICEATDYLEEKQLLIKDCNNKESYDRTVWYAMENDVRERSLSDLIWFDVRVTRKLRSILAGTIYHNLRFHLRKMLDQDPECVVPYHRLNQAMLARALFVDVATVKRRVKILRTEGFVLQHPKKRNLYTLVDEREYRLIDATANAIVASVNANDASANGVSVNANDASVNTNSANMNANDASVNDNTLYETNQKPVRNHSEKGAWVSADLCLDAKGNASGDIINKPSFVDHKLISDSVGSAPLRGKENTDAKVVSFPIFQIPTTFDQLLHLNKACVPLLQSIDEITCDVIRDNYQGECKFFIEEHLDAKLIHELWGNRNRDIILEHLSQQFAEYIKADLHGWKESNLTESELWQLLYYPSLETLVCAFADDDTLSEKPVHSMAFLYQEVLNANWALICKLHSEADFSAEEKCELFKQAVVLHNKYGWTLRDGSHQTNAVQPMSSAVSKIREIFALNPDITVGQLFRVLDLCVDTRYMEKEAKAGTNDSLWHARRVKDIGQFVAWLEKIIRGLEIFAECPIQNFPSTERMVRQAR